jgi:hypothetical protein
LQPAATTTAAAGELAAAAAAAAGHKAVRVLGAAAPMNAWTCSPTATNSTVNPYKQTAVRVVQVSGDNLV